MTSSTPTARSGCCSTWCARTAGRSRATGLQELFDEILALTKREVERDALVLFLLGLGELVRGDWSRNCLNSVTISSSFTSSPSNSIADSSITSSAAKIGASARTASAIASDGRESTSISEPSCGR